MLKINRKILSVQNSARGLSIGWKMRFPKCGHIIYQSIANSMYFQKNMRTMCSKPTEKPRQDSISLWGWNMKVSILGHVTYQSVANFVYFQKSRRTVCQESNINSPNESKIRLPCLPISPSPCLPPSVPIRNPLTMVDWQNKISQHLTIHEQCRFPLPHNDCTSIGQLFKWLHISHCIWKETPPLSKLRHRPGFKVTLCM